MFGRSNGLKGGAAAAFTRDDRATGGEQSHATNSFPPWKPNQVVPAFLVRNVNMSIAPAAACKCEVHTVGKPKGGSPGDSTRRGALCDFQVMLPAFPVMGGLVMVTEVILPAPVAPY